MDRSDLIRIGWAMLIAAGLRLLWIGYANVDPNAGHLDDSVFYHNAARFLAQGYGYVDAMVVRDNAVAADLSVAEPTALWPIGYPALLAAFYKLFAWDLLIAKLLNVLFASVTVALTYLVGKRLFGWRVAYAGALTLAAFPGQIYFATLVSTETLFGLIFMLVLYLVLAWTLEREAVWWQVLGLGLVAGYGALVRAEGVLLVPLILGIWLVAVRPWRRLLRYAPVLLLGVILALTPWTVRNAVEFHRFIPLRADAGGAFAAGLNPDFGDPEPHHVAFLVPKPPVGDSMGHWATHPWELPEFGWRKLRALYKDDQDAIDWAQSSHPYFSPGTARAWSTLANIYLFAVGSLALLAVAALPLSPSLRKNWRLVPIAFGVAWSLLFVLVIPQTRYHFPVAPVLSILAAAVLVAVWDQAVRLLGAREPAAGELRRGPHGQSPVGSEHDSHFG
jgi:4-amino-4-deoxy-L-arabinose transferase-like glycosyltransferase